jgi:hypothetical protein
MERFQEAAAGSSGAHGVAWLRALGGHDKPWHSHDEMEEKIAT